MERNYVTVTLSIAGSLIPVLQWCRCDPLKNGRRSLSHTRTHTVYGAPSKWKYAPSRKAEICRTCATASHRTFGAIRTAIPADLRTNRKFRYSGHVITCIIHVDHLTATARSRRPHYDASGWSFCFSILRQLLDRNRKSPTFQTHFAYRSLYDVSLCRTKRDKTNMIYRLLIMAVLASLSENSKHAHHSYHDGNFRVG